MITTLFSSSPGLQFSALPTTPQVLCSLHFELERRLSSTVHHTQSRNIAYLACCNTEIAAPARNLNSTSRSHGFRQCLVQGQCPGHTDVPWSFWQTSVSPSLGCSDEWIPTVRVRHAQIDHEDITTDDCRPSTDTTRASCPVSFQPPTSTTLSLKHEATRRGRDSLQQSTRLAASRAPFSSSALVMSWEEGVRLSWAVLS